MGLLALMLLQESRRAARTSPTGELILLEDQDRSLWNREQIAEGMALVERALSSRRFGPYTLQAAIAAVHAEAPNAAATDWAQIVGLYDVLDAGGSVARGRAEPRRGRGDARRTRGGPGAHRRHPRARRSGRLPPGACGAGRLVPATGRNGRKPELPTRGRSPSRGRSRNGGFSSGDWLS